MNDAMGFAPPEGNQNQTHAAVGEEAGTEIELAPQQHTAPGDVTTLPASLLGSHTIIARHLHGDFHCGNPSGLNTTCRVTLFDLSDGRQVIVMSELASNPGASVTNALDYLLPAVHEALGTKPVEDTVFVEHHHSALSYHGESQTWERYDRVIVEADHAGRPAHQGWEPLATYSEEHGDA